MDELHRSGAARNKQRWIGLCVGVLLLWSAVLRIWFASAGLNAGRFSDERYAVRNIRAVFYSGSLEPSNYYYQSLSYLPQTALLTLIERGVQLGGAKDYSFFDDDDELKPEGYLLCRLTVIAFALLSLWLTYDLGKKLYSPEVGLAAMLLLATSPLHIRLSAMFKPDMLVLALSLLTTRWSLATVRDPRWSRYLLAGAGVGLATSAKLTGAACALLLVASTMLPGLSWRRLLRLAGAGLGAVAVFLVLNPQLSNYLNAFHRNMGIYAAKSTRSGSGWDSFQEISNVSSSSLQGRLVGLAVIAGLAVVIAMAVWQWRHQRSAGLRTLVLASYPAGFALIYALFTSFAKANNFLPTFGSVALVFAWLMASLWQVVFRRAPLRLQDLAGALSVLGLAGVTIYSAQQYAYLMMTPLTWQRAVDMITAEISPVVGRHVYLEDPYERLSYGRIWSRLAEPVPSLDQVGSIDLARSDAEIFASAELAGERSSFYRQRIAPRPGTQVRWIRPQLFVARGEPLVVVLHPARQVAVHPIVPVAAPADPGILTLPLPLDTARCESLSVEIRRPRGGPSPEVALELSGQELDLEYWRQAGYEVWGSDRFSSSPSSSPMLRVTPSELRDDFEVQVYCWESAG